VAYNHQGQRVGRPHVAAWAETEIVLAADLGDGTDDPRATAPDLLRRALACLPAAARAGRVGLRADAGYFAGQLARAAHDAHIAFAIGARRIAPLWRLLAGVAEDDWHDAALRHLPSGYPQVNLAWMWGALLAATMAAWLHQLTATAPWRGHLHGHGVRGGKAMIATLRRRLIAVPGRPIRHARHPTLRLPPGHSLLPEVLARLRNLPAPA
jgi:hypothetical protein